MYCIAKWVKAQQYICGCAWITVPYICHRNTQIFSKSAVSIYANTAQMSAPGEVVAAATTNNMPFAAAPVTLTKVVDIAARLRYGANKLVADNQRWPNGFLRPLVPVADMNIGSTDRGSVNLYQDIVNLTLSHCLQGYFILEYLPKGRFWHVICGFSFR